MTWHIDQPFIVLSACHYAFIYGLCYIYTALNNIYKYCTVCGMCNIIYTRVFSVYLLYVWHSQNGSLHGNAISPHHMLNCTLLIQLIKVYSLLHYSYPHCVLSPSHPLSCLVTVAPNVIQRLNHSTHPSHQSSPSLTPECHQQPSAATTSVSTSNAGILSAWNWVIRS